jgi:hypothetical protein
LVVDEATKKQSFEDYAWVLVDIDLSHYLFDEIMFEREGFTLISMCKLFMRSCWTIALIAKGRPMLLMQHGRIWSYATTIQTSYCWESWRDNFHKSVINHDNYSLQNQG